MNALRLGIVEDERHVRENLLTFFGMDPTVKVVLAAETVEEFLDKFLGAENQTASEITHPQAQQVLNGKVALFFEGI